jgi:hypothetical protein
VVERHGTIMPVSDDPRSQSASRDHVADALGMTIVEARPGRAVVKITVRNDMVNALGVCHGGMIFTLADSAFAFACNSRNRNVPLVRARATGTLASSVATPIPCDKRTFLCIVITLRTQSSSACMGSGFESSSLRKSHPEPRTSLLEPRTSFKPPEV